MENKKQPIKYEVPAQIMEQVLKMLAGGPYYVVGDALNLLRANTEAIYEDVPAPSGVATPEKNAENSL